MLEGFCPIGGLRIEGEVLPEQNELLEHQITFKSG
jgi:hypothetical protein